MLMENSIPYPLLPADAREWAFRGSPLDALFACHNCGTPARMRFMAYVPGLPNHCCPPCCGNLSTTSWGGSPATAHGNFSAPPCEEIRSPTYASAVAPDAGSRKNFAQQFSVQNCLPPKSRESFGAVGCERGPRVDARNCATHWTEAHASPSSPCAREHFAPGAPAQAYDWC